MILLISYIEFSSCAFLQHTALSFFCFCTILTSVPLTLLNWHKVFVETLVDNHNIYFSTFYPGGYNFNNIVSYGNFQWQDQSVHSLLQFGVIFTRMWRGMWDRETIGCPHYLHQTRCSCTPICLFGSLLPAFSTDTGLFPMFIR